jgi:sterol desaturase/sphingolipid hydroxylase (fatty acid hydroxylase superfamily)
MFESDLIERFSRIHPSTPFIAWIPLVVWMVVRSIGRHDLGGFGIAGAMILGALAWSFVEYILHRYVFHWENDTPRGRRIHFLLHGVHHDYPNDKDRLVMPLGVSAPLAVFFYTFFSLSLGQPLGEPFYAGFVVGYLLYDGTHYAVHHFKQRTRIGRWLRRHHMLHHHNDHEGGFGVSSPLWDVVFNTMPRSRRELTTAASASD